jgi:uncharacterized RDD family membrane protein YckC
MDIWIIRDGEKVGPIHDFEIRRKIATGDLPATTPAWHEGLDAWKPLIEIEIFTREFQQPATSPEPANFKNLDSPTPPPLPQKNDYGRRFWARWFDLSLYSGVWWLGMWAAGQDIAATLLNPWVIFLQYVPWFLFEAVLIHQFGCTPGKWLLGLRVINTDGSRLDLAAATRRSLQVMCTGIGFGWGLLALFCQALSLFTAKRLGTPLWDYRGGHQVLSSPLKPLRLFALILLFVAALQLQMIVISPYLFEIVSESLPELKAEYDRNPPWHLPKRSSPPL